MNEEKRNIKDYGKKSKVKIAFLIILVGLSILGGLFLGGALEIQKEVQKTDDIVAGGYNLSKIAAYRTPYVGDNSKVSQFAFHLPIPDIYFKQNFISMEDKDNRNTLIIYYEVISDVQYEGEWPIDEANSAIKEKLRTNALVTFCMIDNVDEVIFAFRDSRSDAVLDRTQYESKVSYLKPLFEEQYGDLSKLGEELVSLQAILEGQERAMKGLELYVWKEAEITGDEDLYYTLLIGTNRNKTISEIYNLDEATTDLTRIKEAVSNYSKDTYLMICHEKGLEQTTIEAISEVFSDIIKSENISSITIDFDNDLTFELEEQTSDLVEYVENRLDIIISSPREEPNSNTYIGKEALEYEEIIKYNYISTQDEVLYYLLSEFEKGNADGLRGHVMRQLCEELLGVRNNVSDESLSPTEWYERLEIKQEIVLPDFSYEGSRWVEELVYKTEIEKNTNRNGGFTIVAPHIFGSYEEEGQLKIFVVTYSSQYRLYGKVLSDESGGIVPVTMTFIKNVDGTYTLEEYERAMDGSYFMSSIEAYCTMPVSGQTIEGLAKEILDYYGDYSDIIELERENLIKHLEVNNQFGVSLIKKRYKESDEVIPLS